MFKGVDMEKCLICGNDKQNHAKKCKMCGMGIVGSAANKRRLNFCSTVCRESFHRLYKMSEPQEKEALLKIDVVL